MKRNNSVLLKVFMIMLSVVLFLSMPVGVGGAIEAQAGTLYNDVFASLKGKGYSVEQALNSELKTFVVGQHVYVWGYVHDGKGNHYRSLSSGKCNMTLSIYKPNGSCAHTYSYNDSDSNWIGCTLDTAGTWKIQSKITGSITHTNTQTITVKENAPSISLSTSGINMYVGDTKTITVSHKYSGSCHYDYQTKGIGNLASVSWGSWNSTGTACPLTINAKEAGSFQLRARLIDSDNQVIAVTNTITVNISAKESVIIPTSVKLSSTAVTKNVNDTFKLTATVSPSNATNKAVTWSSSNSSVATVDANGNVKVVGVGTAVITATTKSGSKKATCTVTGKKVAVTDVKLNKTSLTVSVGNTGKLTATVSPSNAANKGVTWSSSNTKVATVSGGTVKGVSAGTATITVTTADGGKKATCKVTVEKKSKTIKVYKQTDSRWKNVQYGYKNTKGTVKAYLGGSGCGILSLTNAVYYLNGTFINPKDIAAYSVKHGYRVNGVGTSFGLYKSFANSQGAKYNFAFVHSTSNWEVLKKDLINGYVSICSKPGHIMALVDYNKSTNKFLLLDSYPSSNRGTASSGYRWATMKQLKSLGLRSTFYVLKSKK